MSNIVISVENLSKIYRLGQIGTGTLSHDINVWWAKVRGKPNPTLRIGETDLGNRDGEEIWALRDVSFTVQQGEVLGIIGRNGAGKSTLLKILSRVTAPTEGKVKVKGRIASLLEVGTGFHPDLTGRENTYLNGAILGMSRKEIERKFDEIVDFAEVEKFINTPVKRYSSGMYVRLAFAVAAHLDPEILVVDEVLAVGDAEFQKKCLGKMGDVAHEGRTVLFVSHNMGAIRTLCRRAVLLKGGRIVLDDFAPAVVAKYLNSNTSQRSSWKRTSPVPQDTEINFLSAQVIDESGNITDTIDPTKEFFVRLKVKANCDTEKSQIAVRFTNQENVAIFTTANTDFLGRFVKISKGEHEYKIRIPPNLLVPGLYTLLIASSIPGVKLHDILENEIAIYVADMWGYSTRLRDDRLGVVAPLLEWTERL